MSKYIEVTVPVPSVGVEAIFSFKEPFNTYITNRYIDPATTKLTVSSVISITDMLRTDKVDPFTTLYQPAGVEEAVYKIDVIDKVPILSLGYTDGGTTKYIRVPLSYVSSISDPTSIEYINKALVIDLGTLPMELDSTNIHDDIITLIESLLGVTPSIKEVGIGNITVVSRQEHVNREIIRNNSITVRKTTKTELEELKLKYNELVNRLSQLNIVLG